MLSGQFRYRLRIGRRRRLCSSVSSPGVWHKVSLHPPKLHHGLHLGTASGVLGLEIALHERLEGSFHALLGFRFWGHVLLGAGVGASCGEGQLSPDLGNVPSGGQSSDPGDWGDESRTTFKRLMLAAVWSTTLSPVPWYQMCRTSGPEGEGPMTFTNRRPPLLREHSTTNHFQKKCQSDPPPLLGGGNYKGGGGVKYQTVNEGFRQVFHCRQQNLSPPLSTCRFAFSAPLR